MPDSREARYSWRARDPEPPQRPPGYSRNSAPMEVPRFRPERAHERDERAHERDERDNHRGRAPRHEGERRPRERSNREWEVDWREKQQMKGKGDRGDMRRKGDGERPGRRPRDGGGKGAPDGKGGWEGGGKGEGRKGGKGAKGGGKGGKGGKGSARESEAGERKGWEVVRSGDREKVRTFTVSGLPDGIRDQDIKQALGEVVAVNDVKRCALASGLSLV